MTLFFIFLVMVWMDARSFLAILIYGLVMMNILSEQLAMVTLCKQQFVSETVCSPSWIIALRRRIALAIIHIVHWT